MVERKYKQKEEEVRKAKVEMEFQMIAFTTAAETHLRE